MKILLAPAETKQSGGKKPFDFNNLKPYNKEIVEHYEQYIKNSSLEELSKWFGLKNLKEVEKYKTTLQNQPTLKAIQRYTGVAFEYIKYNQLNNIEKIYLEENILLFSNLFGVLKADELIPDYKFKQGAILPTIDNLKYFKQHLKPYMDKLLEDEEVIDLRANFYDKIYKINKPYITMKFIKNGKVVSHWAKAYRGIVVNLMAKHNIQSIAELMNMNIPNLSIVEIKKQKLKTEIIYNLCNI